MAHMLTPNAVRTMLQPKDRTQATQPVTMQVIDIRTVSNTDRHCLILSDGQESVQGMLASQLNGLVHGPPALEKFMFIQVNDYMANTVQGRVIVILLNAQVMNHIPNPGDKIGNPRPVKTAADAAPTGASAQPLYNSTNSNNISANANYNNSSSSNVLKNNNPYGHHPDKAHSNPAPMNISPPSSSHSNNPYGGGGGNRSSVGGGSAPIVRSAAVNSMYTSISDLNLYQSRWTILARVTHKSHIRTWSNAKGEGSLFSVELLDSSGVDIRATTFKEGVDKWYEYLVEGKTYTFSGGRLKVANAKYNNCKSQYEINFDQNSEIHLNEQSPVQVSAYEFVESIAAIEGMEIDPEKQTNVDLLACVISVGDVVNITSKKSGREMAKCDVVLADQSGTQITLTVWGDNAQKAPSDFPINEIVAVRRSRLNEYMGGKNLSGTSGVSSLKDDPSLREMPAYTALQQWFQQTGGQGARNLSTQGGGAGQPASFAERKEIADIKRENLGYQNEKGDFISFKAVIAFFKKDKEGGAWYPACPNPNDPCKNRCKVMQSATGTGESWTCERCNGNYDHCVRRWIFSAQVEDHSGSTWVNFFNDEAELVLGKTADEIHLASENGLPSDAYDSAFEYPRYKEFIFKCKVRNEFYNDENKLKTSVASIAPVDYVKESNELLAAIAQL